MVYSNRPKGSKTIDPVLGSRLLNTCWSAATLGGITLQLHLYSQTLTSLQVLEATPYWGTIIAGMALVWMLGRTCGRAVARHARARAWGIGLAALTLSWILFPLLGVSLALPVNKAALQLVAIVLILALFAQLSTAWLSQERPWPVIGREVAQLSNFAAILAGLCISWLLPDQATILSLAFFLPLLFLDFWPAERCPLPSPKRSHPLLPLQIEKEQRQNTLQLQQSIAQGSRIGWWWPWLAHRRLLSLTLLQSEATIILTSIWSIVPTLYAWNATKIHMGEVLLWLLGTQIISILLAVGLLRSRTSKRLLNGLVQRKSPSVQWATLVFFWATLVLAAVSLALLGNPWSQRTWVLSAAISGYSIAIVASSRAYARLLSTHRSEEEGNDPVAPWTISDHRGVRDLSRAREARDRYAQRCISRWETTILIIGVLLTGFLSDHIGTGSVLMLAGGVLVGAIGIMILTESNTHQPLAAVSSTPQRRQTLWEVPEQAPSAPGTRGLPSSSSFSQGRDPIPLFQEGFQPGKESITTAEHYRIVSPPVREEPGDFAAQYAPIPLLGNSTSDQAHDGNSNNAC